nr:hypothetical protein [Baekduia alba]
MDQAHDLHEPRLRDGGRLRFEAMAQALLSATDDFEEGLRAFKDKRAGSFS